MSADAQLAFRYPWFAREGDPRFVDAAARQAALDNAAAYRPGCLPAALADEAQAHYAAFLLQSIRDADAGAPQGGLVKSEKEGAVERTYMTAAEAGEASAPNTAFAAWDRLARLCRLGGVTVSPVVDARGFP